MLQQPLHAASIHNHSPQLRRVSAYMVCPSRPAAPPLSRLLSVSLSLSIQSAASCHAEAQQRNPCHPPPPAPHRPSAPNCCCCC
ncbi:uncharacterized protein K460DRAFT_203841 [Cucurbitaria berberidis CBS 394.84]|uniref:Uncharacterized protein n=1 Tax=Cucurbitaria berberidis CBS 394.84 TaxID=1168544 RepID=A0A9P4G6W5_9PLEO|nr:uncharacterized protein K460DRAFT_203841 [Cucurbitaria berberidis CBS 394.84]KAF1840136.1 hypothetical protein K460DRAFT_203841 [Cucurbitaria berberidis CBS 394.84]